MKIELIHTLTTTFEVHAQQAESGVEFWLARDLQHLLGYSKWENFLNVVSKAKTACEVSGHHVIDHFPDVRKMVDLGSGSQREVDDLMLTRYACYLIAQNVLERGIRPESLTAAEDVKKVERRLASEEKKSLKNPDALDS